MEVKDVLPEDLFCRDTISENDIYQSNVDEFISTLRFDRLELKFRAKIM